MTDAGYREELGRLARALAAGATDDLSAALAAGSTAGHVRLFVEDNQAKRYLSLQTQLEFLAGAVADLDARLTAYLLAGPPSARDTVRVDVARFLDWIERTGDLTAEQRDHVACQRARQAVEAAARRDRAGHRRFQELWAMSAPRSADLETDAELWIYLNPIRAGSLFVTAALVGEETELPADVLFFAVGGEIRTALLEAAGRALVEELASWGPCPLERWASQSACASREEIVELCRALAGMGLVAFSASPDI